MVAIVPAAGKGTRMASVTGGKSKELLKLGRRTVLERVIDEAREAGADSVVVVSSDEKPELTAASEALGARVAIQKRPLGLGDAIACAEVADEAIVLYGDCVFWGGSPVTRMAALLARGIDGCIAVERVSDEDTWKYGIVEVDENTGGIQALIEKPGPERTSSRWAIAARFGFGVQLMAFLQEERARHIVSEGQELSMTPIFSAAVRAGFDLKAVPLQPEQKRVDCGSPEEYAEARRLDWWE